MNAAVEDVIPCRKALSTKRCIETNLPRFSVPLAYSSRKALSTKRCIETSVWDFVDDPSSSRKALSTKRCIETKCPTHWPFTVS